ncbi:TIGR04219 family outer membrane beta-barrel protein [Halorhodospira halochloris]
MNPSLEASWRHPWRQDLHSGADGGAGEFFRGTPLVLAYFGPIYWGYGFGVIILWCKANHIQGAIMRRVIQTTTVALFLAVGGSAAHATGGIFGLSAGANIWSHSSSGDLFGGDIDDTLDLDSDNDVHLWAEWDHIFPMIPSVRLDHTELVQDGADGSSVDLGHTDFTAFWSPLPLPFVSIDIGLTARNFDGELDGGTIADDDLPGNWADEIDTITSFSGWLPLGYLRAAVNIPTTPLRLEASVKDLSIGDNSITDMQANLVYKFMYAGVMVGYRDLSIELDEFDDITTDISFSGLYGGGFVRF